MTVQLVALNKLRLLESLVAAGVDYVLLRGGFGVGDLDLLVHPGQTRRAANVLAQLGVVRAPSEHHWPHLLFVGYLPEAVDMATASGNKVHVVVDILDRLVVRGLLLGGPDLVDRVLNARIVDENGIPRPAPADAAWIDFLSALLRKSGSSLAPPYPVLGLETTIPRALDKFHGSGTAVAVSDWVARGSMDVARNHLQALAARRSPPDAVARLIALWSGRLGLGAHRAHSTGVRVVLLGPDGAGKSTLSRGLVDALPLPVHEIYMGVFRVTTWHRISRYLPGAGLATRLTDLLWRSTKAQWYARRGHVVVFDRYTYDAGLKPGSKGFRSRFSYYMIESSIRAPDLVIILDVPGAVMFARKGEHDVATLETRRQWYTDIAASLPNAVIIDGTQPPEIVIEEAVDAIWRAVREHGERFD
jgi:thymidylate kinase